MRELVPIATPQMKNAKKKLTIFKAMTADMQSHPHESYGVNTP